MPDTMRSIAIPILLSGFLCFASGWISGFFAGQRYAERQAAASRAMSRHVPADGGIQIDKE